MRQGDTSSTYTVNSMNELFRQTMQVVDLVMRSVWEKDHHLER